MISEKLLKEFYKKTLVNTSSYTDIVLPFCEFLGKKRRYIPCNNCPFDGKLYCGKREDILKNFYKKFPLLVLEELEK